MLPKEYAEISVPFKIIILVKKKDEAKLNRTQSQWIGNNGIAHVFAMKFFDEMPSLYAFTILRTKGMTIHTDDE